MRKRTEIILALDTKTLEEGWAMLDRLGTALRHVKIGPRLYALGGRGFLESVRSRGYDIFLDLKLHDIPNTVALAVDAFARLGLWGLSLHSAGGREMLCQARDARNGAESPLKLLGISVLTSLDDALWGEVSPAGGTVRDAVAARARLCADVGIDGLVSSPQELSLVNAVAGDRLLKVIPGIRPQAAGDDQRRTASVTVAVRDGADYLVIGRPLLEAPDHAATLEALRKEIEEA